MKKLLDVLSTGKNSLFLHYDTNYVLIRLMADGILQIQDIPRHSSNLFQAQYSVFLFRADFRKIAEITEKKLHIAQRNLALRIVSEYNNVDSELKQKEKIENIRRAHEQVSIENTNCNRLNENAFILKYFFRTARQ